MTDSNFPGEPPPLPPDLPAEYAEAYRRAYEDAHRPTEAEPSPQAEQHTQPPVQAEDQPRSEQAPGFLAVWRRPLAAGAGVLAILLVAYLLGRGFGRSDDQTPAASTPSQTEQSTPTSKPAPSPTKRPSGHPSKTPTKTPSSSPARPSGAVWSGDVTPVVADRATASCRYPPSVDSAGNKVTYRPSEAIDEDFTTAWRCSGDGVGVTLTLHLPELTRIAEVGLVPGYAKTDAKSGDDRYAENNRITKVSWTFDDGTSVEQAFNGSPKKRDLQTMRITPTKSKTVTITILESVDGPRSTVAISEVALAQPEG